MSVGLATTAFDLQIPTTPQQVSYPNLGQDIKAVLFLGMRDPAFGWSTLDDTSFAPIGMATASEQIAFTIGIPDVSGAVRRGKKTDKCIIAVNKTTSTARYEASRVEFSNVNGGSITLDWTTVDGTASRVLGYALRGSDILDAKIIVFNLPNAAGEYDRTEFGFPLDVGIMVGNGTAGGTGYGGGGGYFFGVFEKGGSQWALSTKMSEADPSACRRWFKTNRVYYADNFDDIQIGARFVQSISTGVRLDQTEWHPSHVQSAAILGLRGNFQHTVGTFLKAASPATRNDIDLTYTPVGLIVASNMRPDDSGAMQDHDRAGVGFSDGTNHRCFAFAEQQGLSEGAEDVESITENQYVFVKADNPDRTTEAAATASFPTSTARLDWSPNDAAQTQIGYLAFGAGSVEGLQRARGRSAILVR